MAITNIIKPKGANGTSGASPTNGTDGLDATFTQNGKIGADEMTVNATGGEGGDGGNNAGAAPGANGGKGGNASITLNGNIFNAPATTSLVVSLNATGGNGGLGGTGTPNGTQGKGGNATVVANGNIIQPNKVMTNIELDAIAIGGNGSTKGNATATLNGNIVQPSKGATSVTLKAQATNASVLDNVSHNGDAAWGTKTATLNGNIVQGNIPNVTLIADAYPSNGTANVNGNIVQVSSNTAIGTVVTLEATGNHISITNNKITLGKHTFNLTINGYSAFDNTIKDNEFKGSGTNVFNFTDNALGGVHHDTVTVNLALGTFVFNGNSNVLTGFNAVSISGSGVNATLVGGPGDDILIGGDGDDVINGGGGNDVIRGKGGNDTLDGGDGDDFLYGGDGDDILLVSTGTDVLDGMTDPLGDTASFANATGPSGVTVDLNSAGPHDYSTAFNNVPTITTLVNIQNVTGTGYADTLTGDGANNTLTGGAGNDILRGNGGNDTLAGGADSDTAIYAGNYGIDYTVVVNASGDGTVTDLRPGTPEGTDTLSSIEFIQFNNGTYNTATQTFVPNGPVHTAPAGADKTIGMLEDGTYTFVAGDFGFSDAGDLPADTFTAVKVTTLPGAGSLTNHGNAVNAGDTITIADVTGGFLKFNPAANANGTGYSNFTFQVQDSGPSNNLDLSPNTITFDVTAVNDAPAGTDNAILINEDTQYTLTAGDFGFTDPNDSPANTLAAVKVTTLPGSGSLTNHGNAVNAGDVISAADITGGFLKFAPAANSTSPAAFTFQVQDNGGTANGGVDLDQSANTLTFNITPVNDAPAGTDGSVNTLEDTQYTFAGGNFGFTDPNDSPADALAAVKITTLPGAGSLTNHGNAVNAGDVISVADINGGFLKFAPAANANGNGYANFTFQVQDNGGTANGGVDLDQSANTLTINVTSVNDAPAGTDATLSTSLNTAYTFAAGDFGFTDPNDSPANTLAAVKISTLPTDGSLTNHGNAVNAGDFISLADITGGFLKFTPDNNEFGTGYASFTFQVQDNGGTANGGVDLDQSPNTITFDVQGGEEYFGTPGNDTHTGTAFDDIMHVSATAPMGVDSLDGGDHFNGDTLVFDTVINNGINYTINTLSAVYDTADGPGQTSAVNFENLTGSSLNDILTGDTGANIIDGGMGDDVLRATTGGDTLVGGLNTAVGDTADFTLGNGVTVDLSNLGVQNVGGGIGSITLSGIENLTGSGMGDILTGDANTNTLNGAGGDDFLISNGGSDTLDGGTGIDTAQYGITVNPGDITWDTGSSSFKFDTGSGIDTLKNVEVVEKPGDSRVLLVGGGGYATINDAIGAANDGDTILVAPGTYNENVLVDKQVSIVGLGNPGDVVLHGTFASDNGIGGPVNEFLRTGAYGGGAGIGINVAADNVTLSNLTVEDYLDAVSASGPSVSNLTLDGVTMQHSVFGFTKHDGTTLNDLKIQNSTFSDDYIGAYFYNDDFAQAANSNANNTSITGSIFQDITQKGIYAETLQGNTLFDGLTMDNVGQYGGGHAFGAQGANGAGIDVNLKFNTYTGDLTISDFAFTDVGASTGTDPTGHANAAAIAIKARDDASYAAHPADASGLTVTVEDGTIDGTSTGIRAGENKSDPLLNVTGPAVTIERVDITNNLSNDKHDQIDNRTNSLMTVIGTSGDDTYISAQTVASTGQILFIGDAGDDTYVGGTGIIDTVDYSAATQDGLSVNLLFGTASGGGLGNDILAGIENVVGSAHNDTLIGDDGDNALSGGLGNDIFYTHGGSNQVYGYDQANIGTPEGTDVAYYAGVETNLVDTPMSYSVVGGPGFFGIQGGIDNVNDAVFDVERLKFLGASHVFDVDNLGASDLILQNTTDGSLQILTQETAFPGPQTYAVTTGGTNWRVVGTGQFNPDIDRKADILLQDAGGDLKIITYADRAPMAGGPEDNGVFFNPGGASWKAIATGDFNGDAASDVLIQDQTSGAVHIAFLNGTAGDSVGTVDSVGVIGTPGSNWKVIAAGDFNSDGKSDILWQNSATKTVEVYLMNGTNIINTPTIQGTAGLTAVGTGDFNGDGGSDILFKNAAGNAVVWFMYGDIHTGSKTITKPGANYTLSGAEDVDGNGYSDLVWNDTTTVLGSTSVTATLLGGPASLAGTTVMGNSLLAGPVAGHNLIASTGGG